MNATSTTSPTIEPRASLGNQAAFPVVMTIFYLTQIALGFAVYWSLYWLAVPLVLVSSHLMHGVLIALHEASHGLLRKNRTLNEIDGILMAAFGGMSFSLYRVVHQSHHAHLATERDEELWPFVHPGVSRPREFSPQFSNWVSECFTRRSCSSAHLSGRDRRFEKEPAPAHLGGVRRGAMPVDCHFGSRAWFGVWKYFIWLHLAPAWLAANMQSLRKYIEHVGLLGSTVNSSTRSIVAHGWLGNSWRSLCCTSLFMVSITGILDFLTPNFPSSLLSSSRRGRMNDRPFRVIGKHFRISSEAWQILASVRSGTSPSPSARSIWPRLAKEQRRCQHSRPRLRP